MTGLQIFPHMKYFIIVIFMETRVFENDTLLLEAFQRYDYHCFATKIVQMHAY